MKILVARTSSVLTEDIKKKIKDEILMGVQKGLIVHDPFIELSVIEVDDIDLSVDAPSRLGELDGKSN